MTSFFIGLLCGLVAGAIGGWLAYSKFGAKAKAAEVAISDALK